LHDVAELVHDVSVNVYTHLGVSTASVTTCPDGKLLAYKRQEICHAPR